MATPRQHANSAKTHCKRGHEFTDDNTRWYKTSRFCRACERLRNETPKKKQQKKAASKLYYENNRERYRQYAREYYLTHKDACLARAKKNNANRQVDPEKARIRAKEYRERNREKVLAYLRSDKHKESRIKSAIKHHDERAARDREFRKTEHCREYKRVWTSDKYRHDTIYNLKMKIRRRIYMALQAAFKGTGNRDKSINLLGCTYHELKDHIERQFTEGMAWDKCFSGEIHLDHIRPCASFDLTDPEQQKLCFHYTNIQPLWAKDNLKKRAKTAGA